MRYLLMVVLAAALWACGDTFNASVEREYTRTETHVYWYEVPNDDALRDKCSRTAEDKQILACAVLSADRSVCTVYTHRSPAFETLGHEFMHCFIGRWHPQG